MNSDSIDLIYLDPPFNSNRSYNLLYKNTTGLPVPEQVEAFCDAWNLDYEKSEMAKNMPIIMKEKGISNDVVNFWYYMIQALRTTNPKMLAYLIYMTIRLVEMHRILKPTGVLYLHCDPTASHYLKIMLDGIFGHSNYRNEIVWCYAGGGIPKNDFPRKHDIILRYTKGEHYYYAPIFRPYSPGTIQRGRTAVKGKYFDEGLRPEGTPVNDWWIDVPKITSPTDPEKLGYPTQKPLALLDRIILSSSKENDIVFDPFCGCGTTIESAIRNNRQWIGCDIAIHSIKLVKEARIQKYGLSEGADYTIDGIPQSEEQAKYLFEQDPFQFQHWVVEKTGGFCSNRKTGDGGIDGHVYFEAEGRLNSMVISVKGGHVRPTDIRDLRGVLDREKDTKMAGFISLQEPSKAMKKEADSLGYYEYQGIKYPRMQLMTVKDIFDGRFWHCPSMVKVNRKEGGQMYLAV